MTPTDPLAQLRDIHLPDPVSAWPPGPGWWALAALLLIVVCALIVWLWRRHRANAWRRQAVASLDRAYTNWQRDGDALAYLQAANAVLKRAALKQFPPQEVASLSGEDWIQFLDRHWCRAPEAGFARLEFAARPYQPNAGGDDIDQLHRLAAQWLAQLRGAAC